MISGLLFLYIANSKLIVPRKVTDAIDCGSHIDQRSSIGVKFKKVHKYHISRIPISPLTILTQLIIIMIHNLEGQ